MTIEKGSEWGGLVAEKIDGIDPVGDLARDLGVSTVASHPGPWRRLPLDVIRVEAQTADGACSTLTTVQWLRCGGLFRRRLSIISSTSFVGGRRLFSRAHPNDGRLDWLEILPTMTARQRLAFWRRTRVETHLPHPQVRTGAGTSYEATFDRPTTIITAEGDRLKRVVRVEARLIPDGSCTHISAQ